MFFAFCSPWVPKLSFKKAKANSFCLTFKSSKQTPALGQPSILCHLLHSFDAIGKVLADFCSLVSDVIKAMTAFLIGTVDAPVFLSGYRPSTAFHL
jgi:hypothetical protein